jgi:uncharacterized protein YecE (DUF72 family)
MNARHGFPAHDSAPVMRIGCAGWSIPRTHAAHFPVEGSQLERYAQLFNAVEINSSFYRPHQPATWRKWNEAVPANFRFSVKMPKAISHTARLRDCAGLLDTFIAQVSNLGDKLGCLLLQLPPSLAWDAGIALAFFEQLRRLHSGPVACEPRHASWFGGEVDRALREFGVARVAADPARVRRAAVPGGDHRLAYLRLHGSPHVYYDAYPAAVLERLARRLQRPHAALAECWCIFDNTALGHATADALTVQELLRSAACTSPRPRLRSTTRPA